MHRLRRGLLWILSLLVGVARGAEAVQVAVPSCFTDNAVLQQRSAEDRDSAPVIWGWCTRGAEVEVQLPGQPRPIRATRESWGAENSGEWRYWRIRPKDLEAPLAPRSGAPLRVQAKSGKIISSLNFTNVAVGDVWIVGTEDVGLLSPEVPQKLANDPNASGIRVMPVTGLSWTNWFPGRSPAGLTAGWVPAARALTNPPPWLTLGSIYLVRELASSMTVPIGVILVNRQTVGATFRNQNVAGGRVWLPSTERLRVAAKAANRQVQADYENTSEHYRQAIRQAKRRGEVWSPPQGPVELPMPSGLDEFCEGPVPALGSSVAGACW